MRLFFGDVFGDRHVPMEMTGATVEELCVPRGLCRGFISEARLRDWSVVSV
jgi:hypothetical protein